LSVTKEKQIIYSGSFSNRPRWGKNGWILLNVTDDTGNNIYKIRDNGEDLTALTTSGNCLNPKWDINSEELIFQLAFITPTKNILMNENGEVLDTLLCGGSFFGSWQHPELIASSSFIGLSVFNPTEDCSLEYQFETNGVSQSSNGAAWIDENRIIWCHTTGIYLTDLEGQETELIRETCNADTYQLPTYAPDKNKVIFQRMERILDTESSGRVVLSLVMMNIDGTEEETIIIE